MIIYGPILQIRKLRIENNISLPIYHMAHLISVRLFAGIVNLRKFVDFIQQ
jgi:hypothetical protein